MQQTQAEFRYKAFEEEQRPAPAPYDEVAPEQAGKTDRYAEYDYDSETENEKAQRLGNGDMSEAASQDGGQEDVRNACIHVGADAIIDSQQEFTMTMMLDTLDVNFHVVGFDRLAQRWSD